MAEQILVIGATGMLGEPVARALQKSGHSVAILARDTDRAARQFPEGFEIRRGNVLAPESLTAAMADCDGLHINLSGPFEQIGVEQSVAAAQASGIKRITLISGISAHPRNHWSKYARRKLLEEAAVRESGIPWTIFRPTWFMEALAGFVRQGKAWMIGYQPHELHWLAAEDYARVVVEAWRREDTVNRCFRLLGPEGLTMDSALAMYCATLHPELPPVKRLPFWQASLLGMIPGKGELGETAAFMKDFAKMGEGDFRLESAGEDSCLDARTVFGPLTTTLAGWLAGKKEEE
jgi:uncharacterized protein YbjT (DUF2867 family)